MEKEIINKKEVLEIAIEAIKVKIGERFSGYSSPLNSIADRVISEHEDEIKDIFETCISTTLKNKTFKETIQEEFTHKIAKAMVGKLEGSVEKAVEKLRQDQTIRARMILAIENIIKENE